MITEAINRGSRMKHRKFAVIVLVVLVALTLSFESTFAANKPNILAIWGDDVGQSNIRDYMMGVRQCSEIH